MHVLPRVRELHERFTPHLEVIGVHAGKFPAERRTERIADACARLGVHHPVMNDRQFRVWHDYTVKAWPTVALIDTEGYLVGTRPGEFDVEAMAESIGRVIEGARQQGTLALTDGNRLSGDASRGYTRTTGMLRFPTRTVLQDGRLLVSDTGHGRVLDCRIDEDLLRAEVVGEYRGFEEPRGLAFVGADAFVADRAGHSIWRLDPDGERERVAGTGRIGESRLSEGPARDIDLRSPWGLSPLDGALAVTMAGSHQLWRLDLTDPRLTFLAGAGAEDIGDGDSRQSLLAQPTGVTLAAGGLAFADCETSAVRMLKTTADGFEVSTLVGTGLFDFGDRDGTGEEVLLQHCEDVAVHDEVLGVADTYNDRLKRVDPATRECGRWPGDAGEQGALREPAGLCAAGDHLIVCDTGNHRLLRVERAGAMQELEFS